MSEFETSVYYKKDKDIIGAEVRIINKTGDTIDRILITDATGLDELVEKLDNLDGNYVDNSELKTALNENIIDDEQIQVNATLFDGHNSEYYALAEHNHSGQFAPYTHQSTTAATYGAGTQDQYGHVKVRDDLNARNLNISEALSSHQGYELNNRLTTVETSNSELAEAYYNNSLRIKVGRWSDSQGEDGTRIQVNEGSGNGIYAHLYCDKPDYDLSNREIIFVLNNIPYVRTTEADGKTGKLTINLNKGNYILSVFCRGTDGVNPASDQKIIQVL